MKSIISVATPNTLPTAEPTLDRLMVSANFFRLPFSAAETLGQSPDVALERAVDYAPLLACIAKQKSAQG